LTLTGLGGVDLNKAVDSVLPASQPCHQGRVVGVGGASRSNTKSIKGAPLGVGYWKKRAGAARRPAAPSWAARGDGPPRFSRHNTWTRVGQSSSHRPGLFGYGSWQHQLAPRPFSARGPGRGLCVPALRARLQRDVRLPDEARAQSDWGTPGRSCEARPGWTGRVSRGLPGRRRRRKCEERRPPRRQGVRLGQQASSG